MRLRFLTSIAGDSFSFVEGQTIDVPDPAPPRFVDWLRRGIVEAVRTADPELAVAPTDIERAVTRRRRPAARPRRSAKGPPDDDGP